MSAQRDRDIRKDEPDYVGQAPSPREMDMDVAASPGQSRSSTVIQQRLMGETEYQAVLKLVERYLPKFDVDNMVTAMHQCALAAKESELRKRQIIVDPNFAILFNAVKETALDDVAALSPHTASDLLWSCAHLSIFDRDVFTTLIADATRRLDAYSAKGVSLLAFALGWVGHAPRASFMQALVRELRARIDSEFDARGLTMIVYSLMRLGIRDQRLMKIVSDHMLKTNLEGFERGDVCQMAYAFSKLEYYESGAFSLLGRQTLANLNELEPNQVVMSSMAFAYASGQLEEASAVVEGIKEVYRDQLANFDSRQLASYVFAVGKHKVSITPPEQLRRGVYVLTDNSLDGKAICDLLVDRKLQTFSVKEIILISYGLMRIEHRDERILLTMAQELKRRSAELTPIEVVNALYAFTRVEFVHIPFIAAMVEEIQRRNLIDEMSHITMATLVYSLAVCRINVAWIMDAVAIRTCGAVREMSGQNVAMVLWSMAVLNSKTHAEAVVSACVEDMSKRLNDFQGPSVACILWATALLTGTSSALWALDALFARSFWMRDFEPTCYAMIYVIYAALAAEDGLDMSQVYGWEQCRGVYEELTGQRMSVQNNRLAERLRMQSVPHAANSLPPALDGFREPGVRADIVLESLQLIIEVEGPQRMTIPLEKFLEQIKDDEEVFGKAEDVVSEARTKLECNLTGSAVFKRRILRKCGWRMVTISFDENEEYIVDALCKMNKDGRKEAEAPEAPEAPESEGASAAEPGAEGEDAAAEEQSEEGAGEEAAKATESTFGEEMSFLDPANITVPGVSAIETSFGTLEDEMSFTEYEERLRQKHQRALRELQRRVAEVQGNAVSASAFKDHFEYRRHQVSLEKDVFRELVDAGV